VPPIHNSWKFLVKRSSSDRKISFNGSSPDDLKRLESHFFSSAVWRRFISAGYESDLGDTILARPKVGSGQKASDVPSSSSFGSDKRSLKTTKPRRIEVTRILFYETAEHSIESPVLTWNDEHARVAACQVPLEQFAALTERVITRESVCRVCPVDADVMGPQGDEFVKII